MQCDWFQNIEVDANKKIQGNTTHLGDSLENNEVACQDNVVHWDW